MEPAIVKAYAKINIGLDIVRKRRDGYHDIDTIMQTISLADEITLEKKPGITVYCSDQSVPTDNTNTAYKAALLFFKEAGIDYSKTGISIAIKKNIPSQAGLGGGSSDAAAVLSWLNRNYGTNYGSGIMRKLALEVGSDVPFFIEGSTQRAFGRGEKLVPLTDFNDIDLVVVMPGETVSTAYAYSQFAKSADALHPDMDIIEDAINSKNVAKLGEFLGNTFEGLVFSFKPAIKKARHDILKTGAVAASMTGSGSAVYGVYDSAKAAKSAFSELSHHYTVYIAKTIGG